MFSIIIFNLSDVGTTTNEGYSVDHVNNSLHIMAILRSRNILSALKKDYRNYLK